MKSDNLVPNIVIQNSEFSYKYHGENNFVENDMIIQNHMEENLSSQQKEFNLKEKFYESMLNS